MTAALEARGVTFRAGGRALVDRVDLALGPGEVVGLVGPNGAGKLTLIALLAGDLPPDEGEVLLRGAPLRRPAAELARERAVLPQSTRLRFGFTAREVVEMGRRPHTGPMGRMSARDHEAVDAAMERVEVGELAGRAFPTLSGGEAARVSLARVLAQEAPVLLLDEPTASLDLRHQHLVMRTARDLAAVGCSVAVVLHDLNLAAADCDRIGLMDGGRLVACAPPWEALTAGRVAEVFGQEVLVVRHPRRDRPLVVVP